MPRIGAEVLDRPYTVSGTAAHIAVAVSLLLVLSQSTHCWESPVERL